MDTQKRLQKIENEIASLTQQRAKLFNEWAYITKKNERIYDIEGYYNPQLTSKADDLLREQKAIGKKVIRLLEQADNLIAD